MTILQLSEVYDISISELKKRIQYLGITGLFSGKNKEFSDSEVDLILQYDLKNHYNIQNKKFNKRKIGIMEFYFKTGNGLKVSRMLNIGEHIVYSTIKEWKKTGCLVIESQMNSL